MTETTISWSVALGSQEGGYYLHFADAGPEAQKGDGTGLHEAAGPGPELSLHPFLLLSLLPRKFCGLLHLLFIEDFLCPGL